MVRLNNRLKPHHMRLYTVTPIDISQLTGMKPDTLALQALDDDGRMIYVHTTPSQLLALAKRLDEVGRQGWFKELAARFIARVRNEETPYHRANRKITE
jgi:hypothetical protein